MAIKPVNYFPCCLNACPASWISVQSVIQSVALTLLTMVPSLLAGWLGIVSEYVGIRWTSRLSSKNSSSFNGIARRGSAPSSDARTGSGEQQSPRGAWHGRKGRRGLSAGPAPENGEWGGRAGRAELPTTATFRSGLPQAGRSVCPWTPFLRRHRCVLERVGDSLKPRSPHWHLGTMATAVSRGVLGSNADLGPDASVLGSSAFQCYGSLCS